MKKMIVLCLGIFFTFQVMSQEKTDAMLFGDVKSAATGEHIPYATVRVKGTRMGTVVDGSGHYKLAHLPLGKCTIVASAVGYKTQEKEVFMEKEKALTLFFDLEEDILNLEQVVVTGTRTQHYIKDAPVRTEVITSQSLENKNAKTLFEALDAIPGVRVETQCQYCNFTMVRMQGLGAEHTQVLINGQPTYSGLAGVYGLQQLSTADIDRIEIVKGAGSALYGSSAVAGAINIITKEPPLTPTTNLDMQFGQYHTNRYRVSSSMKNGKGNIGLNIYAERLSDDALDETGEGNTRTEVKHKDAISDRVESKLNNVGFDLYLEHPFFTNDRLIIRGKSVFENRAGGTMTDDYYMNPLTDGTENITTDRYETELQYTTKIKTNSELNFSLAYINHNRKATNDSFLGDYMSTHNDTVPDLRIMRPYLADENSWTSTLSISTRWGKHSFLAGAQTYFNKLDESGMYVVVDDESNYYGEPYKSTADKSAREFGAFIQDEWALTDKLMAVPGIRVDYHHSEEAYTADQQVFALANFPKTNFDETSISPRVALKYEVSPRITLRASAGSGFRAPYGFSEDLHLCSGSPRVWKSSDLKPEKSVSYNLSADYYGSRFRLSANFFRTNLKNKIGFTDADPQVAALGYDYQWRNISDAFVQGIELSAMVSLARSLDLDVDFTVNQGEYDHVREDWVGTPYEKESKYISRFPSTTGNIKLEYTPGKWYFALTGSYQGEMYIDYYADPSTGNLSKIKETDPFMLFNARLSRKIWRFKFYAGVNNIFNYIQDERHLDDAAFLYAPVFGTLAYGGVSLQIIQ
jgi:outer membrane receptor for ferrienterochelin and colicins